jgi:Ran GTPase-activating protein (RanGAP) involved in mRNA processing and transport
MVESWIDAMRDGEHTVRAQLGSTYVERFCRALAQNQSVTSLDLEGSSIDCRGMTSLSAALSQHPTLTRLRLFRNSIGDEGCMQLADVLAKRPPPRLLHLDLRFNAFTERFLNISDCSIHQLRRIN